LRDKLRKILKDYALGLLTEDEAINDIILVLVPGAD